MLEGMINENGFLFIKRNGDMKDQKCPYSSTQGEGFANCGDWCPLFDEPYKQASVPASFACSRGYHALDLCNKKLLFSEFEDRRK